jgi:hypothetical protein
MKRNKNIFLNPATIPTLGMERVFKPVSLNCHAGEHVSNGEGHWVPFNFVKDQKRHEF